MTEGLHYVMRGERAGCLRNSRTKRGPPFGRKKNSRHAQTQTNAHITHTLASDIIHTYLLWTEKEALKVAAMVAQ